MAVELEKIASLLDGAHEEIEKLTSEKEELMQKVAELQETLELSKNASDNDGITWDNPAAFGGVSDETPSTYESPESRLDSFLND